MKELGTGLSDQQGKKGKFKFGEKEGGGVSLGRI